MADNEYTVSSMDVLSRAGRSGCSAYDCEFVSLAMSLDIKRVTGNRKLVRSFPEVALSAQDFLRQLP